MCGIAGLCGWRGDWKSNLNRMCERMRHRGPDGSGLWAEEDGSVALGHRRLAIIDLSETGAQPMRSGSGRYVISFNGEIYNHKEIAGRLLQEGRVSAFRGSSDTEALLEAAESWGVKRALSLCKGMFAAAFWDRKERTLTLARDRVGEKPLYYGWVSGSFVFASDMGSIAVLDGFEGRIDRSVLPFYFIHGYIPAPCSIYENIRKLPAGCLLTIKIPAGTEALVTEPEIVPYWSMREAAEKGLRSPFQGSRKEAADELERLLKESIKGQMEADVPVGAFLSAGIDSSTVVSLMQDLAPGRVRTFTIGMEEKEYNEADAAERIAARLGTDHMRLTVTEKEAREVIPRLSAMFAEPFGDSSQIPTYLVSRMTREHVTVALSGDGGDELFAGYNIYGWCGRIWGKLRTQPAALRKAAGGLIGLLPFSGREGIGLKGKLLLSDHILDVYRTNYERDELAERLALPAGAARGGNGRNVSFRSDAGGPVPGHCASGAVWRNSARESIRAFYSRFSPEVFGTCPLKAVQLQDMLLYHPDDILVKVDRTAMAVSLETRVPMLDKDVVEFAWSLPEEYLRRQDTGKLVLRDVLYRYVPKEMMDRPKKGFSIPIRRWLLEPELRAWAEELLDPTVIRSQGFLDADAVSRIWKDFTERGIWRVQIWYLLMFQDFLRGKRPGPKKGADACV